MLPFGYRFSPRDRHSDALGTASKIFTPSGSELSRDNNNKRRNKASHLLFHTSLNIMSHSDWPLLRSLSPNCQPLAWSTSWFDFCRERCIAIIEKWLIINLRLAAVQLKVSGNRHRIPRRRTGGSAVVVAGSV